jgi:plasmid segregation protein ParM
MTKIAIDCGHGYVKGLSESGERVLFPSLIAHAGRGLDMGPLTAGKLTTVQWNGEQALSSSYLVGEDAMLQASSLFGNDKAADSLTRDMTVIAASRLLKEAPETVVSLAVGVPLAWFGRERARLPRALEGIVRVNDHILNIARVEVFPQGVAAVLSALPAYPMRGLYGLIDVGYRTTDYLVVQVGESGLPTVVPGLAGSFENGVHHALQEVSTVIEQQWKVSYAPHELADMVATIMVRGHEIAIASDIREAYERLGQELSAKLQTVWAPVLPRLRTLYLAGGGVGVMPRVVGEMPVKIVPDPQWANAQGYLAAMGPC